MDDPELAQGDVVPTDAARLLADIRRQSRSRRRLVPALLRSRRWGGDGDPRLGEAAAPGVRPDAELLTIAELLRSPFDPLLTDGVRLRLQAALQGLPAGGAINFTGLRRLLGLTDGNLGMHLKVLVEAGYVEPSHSWRGRRRSTFYAPTAEGRAALERHVAALEAVISATKPD